MNRGEGLSLLAVFAHPDDESFAIGGSLARYVREGVQVALVCATRGEAGEISDPALATPDTLGSVREEELRRACSVLGVRELRFLDYVDGTLDSVDRSEAVGKVVGAIREYRPDVVVTWGPDGGYGHPDHVAVNLWSEAAFQTAGDPTAYPEQFHNGLGPWKPSKLYHVALARERFQKLGEMAKRFVDTTTWDNRNWATFGVPEDRITTALNVRAQSDTKLEAIASHQTQFHPEHPYALMPRETIHEFFGEECFVLAMSHVDPSSAREDDLFHGLRGTAGRS